MSTIWGAIREALRGGRRDYTEGSLNKAILLLAIPMVLETAMEPQWPAAGRPKR